jgi:hypothetical protein
MPGRSDHGRGHVFKSEPTPRQLRVSTIGFPGATNAGLRVSGRRSSPGPGAAAKARDLAGHTAGVSRGRHRHQGFLLVLSVDEDEHRHEGPGSAPRVRVEYGDEHVLETV